MVSQVQNTGLAEFVSALVADNTVKYIDWGGGTGAAVTATNLTDTSFTETRTTGTASAQTTNTTGDTYRVTGTIVANATRAVTEVGVFDTVTANDTTLRIYGDFAVINLILNDSIAFTIDTVLDQG